MSELAGCTFSSTHLRISLERAAQAVALRLEVARHGLDVGGQFGPRGLQAGHLFAQLLLDSACSCAAFASASAMAARAVSSAWATIAAASASLSRLVWSTNFWASSSVRWSVSSDRAAASAGAAAAASSPSAASAGRGALLPLELGDALARLAEPLVELAHVLLERLGLLGRLVQVLIDLVDVVALQPEAELHGAEGVED